MAAITLPALQSFIIQVHENCPNIYSEHLKMMAFAAINNPILKYSSFSLQQVENAFQQATSIIGIYVKLPQNSITLPAGYATSLHDGT
jgi:hypothetical protein